ncbi:MAG: cytochrome c3 family protein [Chloroflexi bacterium]|nr:cytochrome c3 family protein [Chloroflexota bacterium]MCL5075152.1 cytochrome c3 family protein [Chloroflexota bacterium]
MKPSSPWLLGSILGAFLVIAYLGVASVSAEVSAQPKIPHPLEGRSACLACHQSGVAGAPKVPADHSGRTDAMCTGCHQTALAAPPTPFPPTATSAALPSPTVATPATPTPIKAAPPTATVPAAPTPLRTPSPTAIVPAGEDTCVRCHTSQGGKQAEIVKEWQESVHQRRGIGCATCHGGNPRVSDMAGAMSPQAGFKGHIKKQDIPTLCGSCHAEISLMRQYGLPTDQLSQYLESEHGKLLAKGDNNVATCFDCHGGHAIKKRDDPSSTVYFANVPATCAKCHANRSLMAPYGIPTDQYDHYKKSVHGVALLEKQDRRAPNCADCHGTHGAAPPGFKEVRNVCGRCHSATRDLFVKGGHQGGALPGAPECITCHGQHDVEPPGETMLIGDQPRHCGRCHPSGSSQRETAAKIYAAISGAAEAFQGAEKMIKEAEANRMIVVQEQGKMDAARTELIQSRAVQHTVSLATIEEHTKKSVSISEEARHAAEQAIAESNLRRLAMVVVVLAIALIVIVLIMVKREIDKRGTI